MEEGYVEAPEEDGQLVEVKESDLYRKTIAPDPSRLFEWCRNPLSLEQEEVKTLYAERYIPLSYVHNDKQRFSTKSPTHLIYGGFGGGKLYIPDEAYDTFLACYLQDIKNGVRHSISEQRSAVFKMHADFDITDVHFLANDEVEEWVRLFNEEIIRFYDLQEMSEEHQERTFTVYILRAPTKKRTLSHDGETFVITGVHLVWPNLYVNSERALYMRQAFVERLYKEYGKRVYGHCWENIVDSAVYIENGLRMPYSVKVLDKCPYCQKKGCLHCEGSNKTMTEMRAYIPVTILGMDGQPLDDEMDKMKQYPMQLSLLKNTTIRLSAGAPLTEPFEVYEGAPKPDLSRVDQPLKKNQIPIMMGSPQYNAALELIHAMDSAHYAALTINDVFCNEKSTLYTVRVRGTGQYCHNKQDYHHAAKIYFVIDERGIAQRCFCQCEVVRKQGRCSQYKSNPFSLTSAQRILFFSHADGYSLLRQCFSTGDNMAKARLVQAMFCCPPARVQVRRVTQKKQQPKKKTPVSEKGTKTLRKRLQVIPVVEEEAE